jgi:hypothetical protein
MSENIRPELTTDWGRRLFGLILTSNLNRGQTMMLCRRASGKSQYAPWYNDALALCDSVIEIQPLVTPEQFDIGINVLREIVYTPAGAERKTRAAREFTGRDCSVLDHAEKIELIGFDVTYMGHGIDRWYPEYRVTGTTEKGDRAWFDYVYPSWQSNLPFRIKDRGFVK